MKCMLQKKIKSFTILEILITILISSLIIVASLSVFQISYITNLNTRKYHTKFQQIDYTLNYIERELKDSVFVEVTNNKIILKKIFYNDFLKNTDFQKVSKINKIIYEKHITSKNKFEINRISNDFLNSKDEGKNKLIKDIDDLKFIKEKNNVVIIVSCFNKEFKKVVFLDRVNKFKYLN